MPVRLTILNRPKTPITHLAEQLTESIEKNGNHHWHTEAIRNEILTLAREKFFGGDSAEMLLDYITEA